MDASATGSNTGSAWRTEQHSAVTDKELSLSTAASLHTADGQHTACEPTEL